MLESEKRDTFPQQSFEGTLEIYGKVLQLPLRREVVECLEGFSRDDFGAQYGVVAWRSAGDGVKCVMMLGKGTGCVASISIS